MLPDAFGCVVANRFGGLLDDDADPFDLIKQAETETKKPRTKKKEANEKNKKRCSQKESQKDRRVLRSLDGQDPAPVLKPGQAAVAIENGHGKEQDQRGMKRAAAGQKVTKDAPLLEYSIDKPSYNPNSFLEVRGDGRSRRGARFGGNLRNPDSFNHRGKREFDRYNGTGISSEEKRGGRGPWNWGAVQDATSEVMEVTSDAQLKSEEAHIPAEQENPNCNPDVENGEIMVNVAMEMSLDEWKAMQEMKRPKSEFNIRKAEDKIPSKAKVIHQSKNLEILKTHMEGMCDEAHYLRKSVNDITSLLDINFGSLGRTPRGGRGRGVQGGQSARSERAKVILEKGELAPNPDDPEDFPALSAGK